MGTKPEEFQTIVKIAEGGRITIPKRIRDTLGIKMGDNILINVRKLEE